MTAPEAERISDAEIAEAEATGTLHLAGRDLPELPDRICELTGLRELWLDGTGLQRLPTAIGALINLRTLWLRDNQLADLPAEIGQLSSLEDLWLDGNQLRSLPPEIGKLRNLAQLSLIANDLTYLPPEIGGLSGLQTLRLDGNDLIALPTSIGELAKLRELSVADNGLTGLPTQVGLLRELTNLLLDGNQINQLPAEIGQLISLRTLQLNDNELTWLPRQLAGLLQGRLQALSVERNPLADPLPQLLARGPAAVAAYLSGLAEEVALYEAKVLLVGEGGVGKSSVLAALLDQPFVDNRPPTHAIDIQEVDMASRADPWGVTEQDNDLLLRFWDFGGQSVYRVSNQYFYSPHAIFLLVWSARGDANAGDVVGWLRRIGARAGEYAQVVLVGTSADAPGATALDPAVLPKDLAGMVRGSYLVDNASGRGIKELKRAIVEHAGGLEHLGTRMPVQWAAVRAEIAARAAEMPSLPWHEYVRICERREVIEPEAQETLAGLMHDLGQVIHHGEVDGLREIIVLDPEWVAKAIGAILIDVPTAEAGGVLDHARLPHIWSIQGRRAAYPRSQHAFLLRLMEEFDISWRLEDGRHSLIAPLVPERKPVLPWRAEVPLAQGILRLQVRCSFQAVGSGTTADRLASAPGLISALTVRHHHASTNQHWRSGVFLCHPNPQLESTALIELLPVPGTAKLSDNNSGQVMVEVRGPDPAFFFHVLVESIEDIRRQRWPGLTLDLQVPCSGLVDSDPCPQTFSLADLRRRRRDTKPITECVSCGTSHNTIKLLTGFAGVAEGLTPTGHDETAIQQHLHDLADGITVMRADMQAMRIDMRGGLAVATKGLFHVLLAVNTLVRDVPRLFTIVELPHAANSWRRHQDSFELMLWCEHQGEYHPVPQARFIIRRPKKWLRTVRPYATMVLGALKPFLPLLTLLGDGSLGDSDQAVVGRHLEALTELGQTVLNSDNDEEDLDQLGSDGRPRPAVGAALRAFRMLILDLTPGRVFPGLDSYPSPSGEVVWVCDRHAPNYRAEPMQLS